VERLDFVVALHNRWQGNPVLSLIETIGSAIADSVPPELCPAPPVAGADRLEAALRHYVDALGADIFLILDQFEEWFLYQERAEDERAATDLVRAMADLDLPVHYLLSLREDALARLDWFKGRVPGVFDNLLRLKHLDRQAAREAIEGPIDRFNEVHDDDLVIEPPVVDRVLADVRIGAVTVGPAQGGLDDDGVSGIESVEAPFLQLVMTRLWDEERLHESARLRLETLDALGGADRIVHSYFDESLDALPADDQALAADVFHHLVTPSGTKIAHSATDLADYTGRPSDRIERLLRRLAELRILRPVAPAPGHEQATRYEIFHDVLAASILDWRTRFLHERSHEEVSRRARRRLRRFGALSAVLLGVVEIGRAHV